MGDNDEHMISESEVNKMLGEQAEKYNQHLTEQLQNRDRDHKLDKISSSVSHIDKKICEHIITEKEEKTAIMDALEKVGNERRQCETEVNERIDSMVEDNHKTFVKKSALRNYAVVIITAVTLTTSFITWVGVKNTNVINDDAIAKIAKTVVIKLTEKK